MDRDELITKCKILLGTATGHDIQNKHESYTEQMSALLDLLLEELIGCPPGKPNPPAKHFNPETILIDIANAIKYRTISGSLRWKIIYYYSRITCVPLSINVPDRIVLHKFTEKMANDGFSVIYWNQLKQNIIKLYKELES